jgi:hypothetical protein
MSVNARLDAATANKTVERLFARMAALYGSKFADQWAGINPADVKKCWAEEIAAYPMQQIAAAVNALTTKNWPPTLPEFLELIRAQRPALNTAAHNPTKSVDAVDTQAPDVLAAKARCMASMARGFSASTPAWAYRAKRRWLAGEVRHSPVETAKINRVIERDRGMHDPFLQNERS